MMVLNTRRVIVLILALSRTHFGVSEPTISPTSAPTKAPSAAPTAAPTTAPTTAPTIAPTAAPTKSPTMEPSRVPTSTPTNVPSRSPSYSPSVTPTRFPSSLPSTVPSKTPTNFPSKSPSVLPSKTPTVLPNMSPSKSPSGTLTDVPSKTPSGTPTNVPSKTPSGTPTNVPSKTPSITQSHKPTEVPTGIPSKSSSASPSTSPSTTPSITPSVSPTKAPSVDGSKIPSVNPSKIPTVMPSNSPTSSPSKQPSTTPSFSPSVAPSKYPSRSPTVSQRPTVSTPEPTSMPSDKPSVRPPVIISAVVEWTMSSVIYGMNEASLKLFEDEALKWVNGYTANITPKVIYTDVDVEGQFLFRSGTTGTRRRLSQLFPLLLKVRFTGAIRPENKDLNLEKIINDLTSKNGDTFISDLKQLASESGSKYFANVKTLSSVGFKQSNFPQPSPAPVALSESDNKTSNILIIILSILVAILCVGGVALVIYFRTRTSKNRAYDERENALPHSGNDDSRGKMSPRIGADAILDDDMTDGGRSQTTFQTLDHLYSQDNQSFSYSLDDGNEKNAPNSTKTSNLTSLRTKGKTPTYTDNFSSQPTSGRSSPVPDDDNVSQDNITPLTTGGRGIKKNPDAEKVRRDCFAPPGKLGVVIDTTNYGPVVHEVKAGSPLEGVIFAGDRIVAIDDVDTKTLSASAVTKIMARKMEMRRKISVMSSTKVSD